MGAKESTPVDRNQKKPKPPPAPPSVSGKNGNIKLDNLLESFEIAIVKMRPHDVLVLNVKEMIDASAVAHIQKSLEGVFCEEWLGFPVKVIVLSGDVSMSVVRNDD